MMMHRIKIVLIFFLSSNIAGAQLPEMKKLGLEDGMSSNYIRGIVQDKNKFMWFATGYGLNRFDGNKFTRYMGDVTDVSDSNEINCIAADTLENTIWLATRWAGIKVFDCTTETFKTYRYDRNDPHGISSDDITDILVTEKGQVWLATYNTGLNHYNRKTGRFEYFNKKTIPGFASDQVLSVSENKRSNKLYIGHADSGFSVFSPEDLTIKNYQYNPNEAHSLPHNTVYCIYIDLSGNVWIGTGAGLTVFNPTTGKFRNFNTLKNAPVTISSQSINCIQETKDGTIWVGTVSDLCYFKADDLDELFDGRVKIHSTHIKDTNTGLSNPSVYSVFQDSFNNIWIGSNGGGVRFISNTAPFFRSWRGVAGIPNGLSDKDASAICTDQYDNLWIGTDGGGINVFKKGVKTKVITRRQGGISSDAITSALKDSKGNLWFGHMGAGIDIYNERRGFTAFMPKTGSPAVYCLYEDSAENVWIGTGRGIQSYNLNTRQGQILNKSNSSLAGDQIRTISQDSNGFIWVGTMNRGISILDPEKNIITNLNTTNGLFCDMIKYIYRDSRSRMWVATTNGLAVFPAGQMANPRVYDSRNGLTCNYIRAIAEDKDGNIWVSTNFGISCFIEKEKRFLNYDHADAIPIGNFMDGSVATTTDGSIYFGSQNGVCFFNPAHRPANVILPPLVFTEFKIHEKQTHENTPDLFLPISSKDLIELAYDQNNFTISFNVMDYALKGQIEYSYQLDGLSDMWFNLADHNQISFRNIPPKEYTLRIKARYKNQAWPDSFTSLSVHIHPPFWLTWWAKCLYACILLTIIVLIMQAHKKRLQMRSTLLLEKENIRFQKELNEERLRFYTNITHELRTPLTLILGPLEDLQNDSQLSVPQTRKVSLIHQSATRLLNLVTQILELRKVETQNRKLYVSWGNLNDIIQATVLKYKELNRNDRVDFNISIETTRTELFFDAEVITIILDNLLSNAFKYTDEGQVSLKLRSVFENEIEYTEIEVADTGEGIPENEQLKIFDRHYQVAGKKNVSGFGIGLALVSDHVMLHEGSIVVRSQIKKGTSFFVRLLTGNTYPDAIHVHPDKTPETDSDRSSKPIVLLVEDDRDIRNYVASSLIDYYEVILAEDGRKGVELAVVHTPDIIISDIIMPEKDGIELCRELKEDVRTSHIPIILLTAKDTLHAKTQGYDAGADSYVTKPFSATLLRSRVINLLDARRKIAQTLSSNISMKQSLVKESLNKLDNAFLEKIIYYIEDNLEKEKIDNTFIVHQMGMSYSSVYRKIKAITGMSVNEFIGKIKMQKAEQLLLTGKYSISEISYQVGFNSISHFRECFKGEFGHTPSEYLRMIKEEK